MFTGAIYLWLKTLNTLLIWNFGMLLNCFFAELVDKEGDRGRQLPADISTRPGHAFKV